MAASGLILVALLWQGGSLLLGTELVPSPLSTLRVFLRLLGEGVLLRHAAATLIRLLSAMVLGLMAALPLGIWAGVSRSGNRVISPLLYVLYPVPKIAFLPLFMILFGLGNNSKIILLFSVIVFQLAIASRDGVKSIPVELHRAARVLQLSAFQRFTTLYLPSTLPRVFSALRITVGIGMAVLFLAENYATQYGLGYFIMNNWVMISYPRMFAGILALGLLSSLILLLLDGLQRVVIPWYTSE
ncbi:Taurine transport system permease protein TauC [Salinispira pacifica]|uniref:Taurine transport system permease protein TauC n=2 Tax=Salinispira pacifica TaxID=1307761 RepID=V5WKJ8_9SPIO|nr:Taurine transport system permease protein TauC [Salinispira pacifica]